MRAALFCIFSAFVLVSNAQFTQTAYSTPIAAGIVTGGGLTMKVSVGEFGSAAEADSENYRLFSGFLPGTGIVFSFALELDKEILETIFSETGGTLWVNKTGWLSDPDVANWFGVTIENQRVTQLLLPNNDLSGAIPNDITGLTALKVLNVSGNKITAVPNLTLLPTLTSADLRNNNLDFDQLIPNVGVAQVNPQKPIGIATADTLFVGSNIDLSVPFETLGNNVYQWTLNGNAIVNSTGATLAINSIDYGKMGVYKVTATNSAVPGLTLSSDTMRVMAIGNIAIQVRNASNALVGPGSSYLMKISDGGSFDTTRVEPIAAGIANMSEVILGDYLLSAVINSSTYLPSYYRETFLWEEADTLKVRSLNETANIRLTNVPVPLTPDDGSGIVGGYLEIDVPDDSRVDARRRVANTRCHIRRRVTGGRDLELNNTYVLVASVTTNENGEFRIQNMPAGFYRINFEFPGVPMDESSFVEFEISATQNELTLAATITETGIVVERINTTGLRVPFIEGLVVYPNPMNDVLQFSLLEKQGQSNLRIYLVSNSGATIGLPDVSNDGTYTSGVMDVSKLRSGVYYLVIETQDKTMRYGHRLIKR